MKRGGAVKFARGGTADADSEADNKKVSTIGNMFGKTKGLGPKTNNERDSARYDDYKRGGGVSALARGGAPEDDPRFEPFERSYKKGRRLGTLGYGPLSDSELHDMADANDLARPKSDPAKKDDYYKHGGDVKHAQLGGLGAPRPGARPVIGAGRAAPTIPVPAPVAARTAALAKRGAVANRAAVNRQAMRDVNATNSPRARVAAGPRPTYKGGGKVHDDEAQDKKLISRMIKQEEKQDDAEKLARGGGIKQGGDGSKQASEPGGYPVMQHAGGGGLGRLEKRKKGLV